MRGARREVLDVQNCFDYTGPRRTMRCGAMNQRSRTRAERRDNGTVYRDEAYIEILAKAASNYNSWYRRSFNTVRDAYGSAYMEATVPAVKRFFRYWGDGELVWLSDK